nr:hypothetical protein GCM10020093_112120 [Planobispora longispora]
MHDVRLVDRDERGDRADRQPVQPGTRARSLRVHDRVESGAVDVLADDERAVVLDSGLQHRGRAERGDPLGRADLADETFQSFFVLREIGAEQFDRHTRPGRGLTEVDRSLAALPESRGEPVLPHPLGIPGPQRRKIRHNETLHLGIFVSH